MYWLCESESNWTHNISATFRFGKKVFPANHLAMVLTMLSPWCYRIWWRLKPDNSDVRTYGKHFNFADIHLIGDQRKLDNDVLEGQFTFADVRTLDGDSGSGRHSARILTTQRVVPQIGQITRRRIVVGQANDEVVWSISISYNASRQHVNRWTSVTQSVNGDPCKVTRGIPRFFICN